MRRATGALAGLVCAVWFAACMAAASPPLGAQTQRTHSVAVVSNGWHAAIVIGRAELVATDLLPEADDFPDAVFLDSAGAIGSTIRPARKRSAWRSAPR